MIEIDGSMHSGSGTVFRYAVALAALRGEPLRIRHIRARRAKPGLRPQHLQAVRACAAFCSGSLRGDEVGSREIVFRPGRSRKGGVYRFDIGTAGSAIMLAFPLLPLALYAETPSRFSISGGLFQDFAPSAFHMRDVLFPHLESMGARIRLKIERPGYVPKGGGRLILEVEPIRSRLAPLLRLEQGETRQFRGTSLASNLAHEKVGERMAARCRELLAGSIPVEIEVLQDSSALQRGAALFLRADTTTGCILGADQAGKPGRRSEAIAEFVVSTLREDLAAGATVDRHLADQLILFAALADGETRYRIPVMTDHVESNLWIVETMLGACIARDGNVITIGGIGLAPSGNSRS
ncbi:MAG TPA: RNA 3'-terminal phosphate cyclase [Syntrophales bacterium]|nr:RNA 3'-terminal phosphate cyclase [Syntrophales bacterium]